MSEWLVMIGLVCLLAIRGLVWSRPMSDFGRLKGLVACSQWSHSQWPIQCAVEPFWLPKTPPDYRHCGLVAPALFSKRINTREKRLSKIKLDEASVAVGRATLCSLLAPALEVVPVVR